MIQSYIDDEQDFVSRLDAEQYTDQCCRRLLKTKSRSLWFGSKPSRNLNCCPQPKTKAREEPLDAWLGPKYTEEPRAVNQIDWIMTTHGLIAGYDSKAMLESYVRSVLPADQSHQAEMLIAMVLTTARNLINKKLEAES
jgi:hypothetical protein